MKAMNPNPELAADAELLAGAAAAAKQAAEEMEAKAGSKEEAAAQRSRWQQHWRLKGRGASRRNEMSASLSMLPGLSREPRLGVLFRALALAPGSEGQRSHLQAFSAISQPGRDSALGFGRRALNRN